MPDDSEVKKEAENSVPNQDGTRLDGWKEIASFLGRGMRTVRRWETDAALPVHRLLKRRRSPVHAYHKELAHWVKEREEEPSLPSYLTAKSLPDGEPNVSTPRDVLAGWKEVAAFLGRSVRTVQRREKEMGLPIRRRKSTGRSIPYALRSEVSAWSEKHRLPADTSGEGGLGLRPSNLLQTIIDGWSACIAVVNEAGTIVAVNKAWGITAQARDLRNAYCGVGKNYVEICKSLSRAKSGPTPTATRGVTDLLKGSRQRLQIRYRANTPTEKRWFLLQSARFDFQGAAYFILIHSDVTELLGD